MNTEKLSTIAAEIKPTFHLFEDNAGGLSLFYIEDGEKKVLCDSTPDTIAEAMAALFDRCPGEIWATEDDAEEVEKLLAECTEQHKLIADNTGFFFDRCGIAGEDTLRKTAGYIDLDRTLAACDQVEEIVNLISDTFLSGAVKEWKGSGKTELAQETRLLSYISAAAVQYPVDSADMATAIEKCCNLVKDCGVYEFEDDETGETRKAASCTYHSGGCQWDNDIAEHVLPLLENCPDFDGWEYTETIDENHCRESFFTRSKN